MTRVLKELVPTLQTSVSIFFFCFALLTLLANKGYFAFCVVMGQDLAVENRMHNTKRTLPFKYYLQKRRSRWIREMEVQ